MSAIKSDADVKTRIREFLTQNFLYMRPDFVLQDGDRLLEKGVIDSMGVMELVEFLETTYQVTPADSEVTEENFGSVSAIARFVMSKNPRT